MKVVYAIRDKKADAFSPLYVTATLGTMERELATAVSNPESYLAKHPGDYDAVIVANYDEVKGLVVPVNHFIVPIPVAEVK